MAKLNLTVNELFDLYETERKNAMARYCEKRDSNFTAQRKKCEFVQYLLESVPTDVVFTIESCRGDGSIRENAMANSGSVVECIVKYHLTKSTDIVKTWNSEEVDTRSGCMAWEVKASCGAKFLATPSEKELTLLVNLDGVSLIKKSEVLNYVNSKKRLPARGKYGNRSFMVEYLEKMLGLENGYQE
jgi:TPP-dependent trihydroxycyclohexane-1,2-dione (THcHDO) dehydratase